MVMEPLLALAMRYYNYIRKIRDWKRLDKERNKTRETTVTRTHTSGDALLTDVGYLWGFGVYSFYTAVHGVIFITLY